MKCERKTKKGKCTSKDDIKEKTWNFPHLQKKEYSIQKTSPEKDT
jgi:hypothetical protein